MTEVNRYIHENRCRGNGAVLQGVGVGDRFDGASWLPVSAQHVIFRLEYGAVCLAVVVCRTGIGEDLAGACIERRNCGIVDLLTMNCFQPVGRLDADALQIRLVLLHLCRTNSKDPLLGGLLHLPVERGDDLVATGVELLLATLGVGAENSHEEVAYSVHKVRCAHFLQRGGDQDDLLSSSCLNLRVGDDCGLLRNTARSGGLQEVEHDTASLGHRRVERDSDHPVCTDNRVLAQVIGARRLGDSGEQSRFAKGELVERLAEILLRGRQNAVRARAVVVVVEVLGDDLLLTNSPRELFCQSDRLDDLFYLALVDTSFEG